MRTSIGQEDCEAVTEKQVRIAQHAGTIVGLAVQENDGVVAGTYGLEEPCLEISSVSGTDIDWLEVRVVARSDLFRRVQFGLGEAIAARMQRDLDHQHTESCAAD